MSKRIFIDLKKEEAEELTSIWDEVEALDILILRTSKMVAKKRLLLWDLIHDLYPEVDDHQATYHPNLDKVSYKLETDSLTKAAADVAELRVLRKLSDAGFDRKKMIEAMLGGEA